MSTLYVHTNTSENTLRYDRLRFIALHHSSSLACCIMHSSAQYEYADTSRPTINARHVHYMSGLQMSVEHLAYKRKMDVSNLNISRLLSLKFYSVWTNSDDNRSASKQAATISISGTRLTLQFLIQFCMTSEVDTVSLSKQRRAKNKAAQLRNGQL